MTLMKKYITPEVEIKETQALQMMALSIKDEDADQSDVLSRDEEWNIWED